MNTAITIILIIILLGLAILALIAKVRKKVPLHDKQYIRHKWQDINRDYKDQPDKIIFEADKLIDYALTKMGKQGTLGEKLKAHGALFSDLNGLWKAHKLRNKLAHELDYRIHPKEAQEAIKQFEIALKDLKCL